MQIEIFCKEDFEVCSQILSLCVKDAKRELLEYMQNESVRIFTAKKDGKIAGLVIIMQTDEFCDLLDIAVDPLFQRKGIAKALCDKVFEYCRQNNVKSVLLEVRKSNISAINLYEKCGFEKIAERKKYYTAPTEDAIIYRREL